MKKKPFRRIFERLKDRKFGQCLRKPSQGRRDNLRRQHGPAFPDPKQASSSGAGPFKPFLSDNRSAKKSVGKPAGQFSSFDRKVAGDEEFRSNR